MSFSLFSRRFLASVCLAMSALSHAQEGTQTASYSVNDSQPVPLLSGGLAFVPTWEAGTPTLVSIISPVLLAPLGKDLVFESRAEFEGDFQPRNGTAGDFTGAVQKTLDYMQLDYIGNRYVTISAGRFLTPFNVFNERLYPNWIRNTQSDPLIFPLGTGSDDGLMFRGGISAGKNLNLNYTAYFSSLSGIDHFESERHVGARIAAFLPRERLEIGASLQHQLQQQHLNRLGWHLVWQPMRVPLELRAEGAFSGPEGSGLWLEGAYRLPNARFAPLRRAQVVARTQAFQTGSIVGLNRDLPVSDTKRTEFTFNYFLKDGWKALAGYGRTFTALGNSNIWTVGMTYRFLLPLGSRQ
ncbi:MAG: hypothetical protein JO356_06070 [Acidobacteria bacterium]|nr:hypothetical protein [Acidobacteriota bacterium]